jgi:hypothetical protein
MGPFGVCLLPYIKVVFYSLCLACALSCTTKFAEPDGDVEVFDEIEDEGAADPDLSPEEPADEIGPETDAIPDPEDAAEEEIETLPAWSRTYGGDAACVLTAFDSVSTGGYIAVGYTTSFGAEETDGWVVRFDDSGGILWEKAYRSANQETLNTVIETPDGGFLAGGHIILPSYSMSSLWAVKITGTGDMEWQKAIDSYFMGNATITSLCQLDSENIMIGANGPGASNDLPWILKINNSGEVQWQRRIQNLICGNQKAARAAVDGTCSFVCGGSPAHMYNVDEDGVVSQILEYPNLSYLAAIHSTSDGNFVLAGTTRYFYGEDDFVVFKQDAVGNIAWQVLYGDQYQDKISSVAPTSDGGFIVGGMSRSYGDTENGDGWIVKLDAEGSLDWQKAYRAAASTDEITAVLEAPGGGYVAAGNTMPEMGGNLIWLLRVDLDGSIASDCPPDLVRDTDAGTAEDFEVTFVGITRTPADTGSAVTDTTNTVIDTEASSFVQCER